MTSAADQLSLVLVGPMAAGKTSVGRRVARTLDVPFIDTDKRVVAAHGPISAIFEEHGEAHFRALERAEVAEALQLGGGVISLGGGAVTDLATRTLLRDQPVVFLTVTPAAVADRIQSGGRPLLAGADPVGRWTKIFEERRDWYDEVATVTFDTSRRPMQRIADDIVAWRRELG